MELFAVIVTQILTYATLALGSGVIASLLTQALKFEFILAPAKRWPRTVAAIVSRPQRWRSSLPTRCIRTCYGHRLGRIRYRNIHRGHPKLQPST